ncbi:MAG TPA: hypothetical protein VLI06_12210 [Solimonas sp.]|nr:hypothetical protein [Solimonas sp.]
MQIVLTLEDLNRLSAATREALFAELGFKAGALPGGRGRKAATAVATDPLEQLVDSINDRALAALKVLVRADGQLAWSAIATKVPKLEMGRFMAAVHRRYRTLTGNESAVLIALDQRSKTPLLRVDRALLPKLRALLK